MTITELGKRAKAAARVLAHAGPRKQAALLRAGEALWARRQEILEANRLDLEAGRAAGMSQALLDRLALTEARVRAMAQAVEEVAHSHLGSGRAPSLHWAVSTASFHLIQVTCSSHPMEGP